MNLWSGKPDTRSKMSFDNFRLTMENWFGSFVETTSHKSALFISSIRNKSIRLTGVTLWKKGKYIKKYKYRIFTRVYGSLSTGQTSIQKDPESKDLGSGNCTPGVSRVPRRWRIVPGVLSRTGPGTVVKSGNQCRESVGVGGRVLRQSQGDSPSEWTIGLPPTQE